MKTKLCLISALVTVSLFFCSCDPADVTNSNLTVDLTKTATLKGVVYADLDATKAGSEFAPEKTEMIVRIPYNLLGGTGNAYWTTKVLVGANGVYTVDVPVDYDGVTVYLEPVNFVYEKTLAPGEIEIAGSDPNPATPVTKQNYTYSSTVPSIAISTIGTVKIQNVTYTGTQEPAVTVKTTTVKCTVICDMDATTTVVEPPAGTKIYISSTTPGAYGYTATTDETGSFTIANYPYEMAMSFYFKADYMATGATVLAQYYFSGTIAAVTPTPVSGITTKIVATFVGTPAKVE